jgi:hypothetical protein
MWMFADVRWVGFLPPQMVLRNFARSWVTEEKRTICNIDRRRQLAKATSMLFAFWPKIVRIRLTTRATARLLCTPLQVPDKVILITCGQCYITI